jgi:hypothetical protein
MEMNAEKTKLMRISRQPSTVQIMVDHKELKNVDYFNCLGSMIPNDARLPWQKQHSTRRLFHQHVGLRFMEETDKLLHLDRMMLKLGHF